MSDDWRIDPATERQREYAAKLGVKLPKNCTKGEASDAIDNAKDEQTPSVYRVEVTLGEGPKRRGLLGRLADAVTGGGSHTPEREAYTPEPTHAKPGTFDESEFVNPKTGGFKFPTYKHHKEFLVKIDDQTDYKDDIWEDLETDERREFDLREFEDCSPCFEFEVDDFETFTLHPKNHYLSDLKALAGEVDTIAELLEALNSNEFCILEDDIEKQLLKGGYVYVRDIVSGADKHAMLEGFTATALKSLARPHKIKLGGKKAELLERMLESGVEFELPSCYVAGPKFYAWAEALADGYIAEIKKNAARFHPMMRSEIWDYADDSGFALVEETIQAVRDSKYWLADMTF